MENALFITNCSRTELFKKANETVDLVANIDDIETLARNNKSHCFNATRQVGDYLPAFISLKSGPFEDIQLTEVYDRIDEMTIEELPICKN